MNVKTEKKGDAQYVIHVSFDKDEFKKKKEKVEKEVLKKVKVDGFREGHVPEDIAKQHIDPMHVLNEAAYELLKDNYEAILKESEIEAIGEPKIQIKKIAEGEDLELDIITDSMPEIELGDYKKIAEEIRKEKVETPSVEEKEIEDVINSFRRMRAQSEQKDGEVRSWNEIPEEELPELDDEYVKKIGDFSSLKDFKEKIKENILKEKELKEKEKKRIKLIDALIEKSKIELPESVIQHELNKMMHEFEGNIVMSGVSFDDYLKSIGKTREDYRREWRDQAVKRAKIQFILDEISEKENIKADEKEVEKEVKNLLKKYKDNGVDEGIARAYVNQILTHQKVFDFLEKDTKHKEEK